jgi:hypothetical protein
LKTLFQANPKHLLNTIVENKQKANVKTNKNIRGEIKKAITQYSKTRTSKNIIHTKQTKETKSK